MATVDKLPMLAEGYEKLQTDVRYLKTVERPAIIEAIEVARGHGDLSENAEYHAAKERQGHVEPRSRPRTGSPRAGDRPDTLSGDKVVSRDRPAARRDDNRSNIRSSARPRRRQAGRISYASLGRALIGARSARKSSLRSVRGQYYQIKKSVRLSRCGSRRWTRRASRSPSRSYPCRLDGRLGPPGADLGGIWGGFIPWRAGQAELFSWLLLADAA